MSDRTTMNGKKVILQPSRTIINFKSGFGKKLLCDDMTFTTGTACAYSCSFCYVPSAMRKLTKMSEEEHMDVVIRREGAIKALRAQLLDGKGQPKFMGPEQRGRVIYASPLVDVAANMELVNETVDACEQILTLTPWHIRLLSKSNLLTKVAHQLELLPKLNARSRVIYGFSTGTLDDNLAKAFEQGTPLVSKRIKALHELQNCGFRTFGMICPSLPPGGEYGFSYNAWSEDMAAKLRVERCEHVWAEVINVRGESMARTVRALLDAGFGRTARQIDEVSHNKAAWERYARLTFEAHRGHYQPGKLRFLQYVNNDNREFWAGEVENGAVLL